MKDLIDIQQKIFISYQGVEFIVCSINCKNKLLKNIFDGQKLFDTDKLAEEIPIKFGRYPDSNDLKTHGDIQCYTENHFFCDDEI